MTSAAKGFTLVEMMVATALMALIALAMSGALRTMAQTEEKISTRIDHLTNMNDAHAFLRQLLGRVGGRTMAFASTDSEPRLPFIATGSSIQWVGIMPARHGMGGRHFFRLQVENMPGGQHLVLRFVPWQVGANAFPDWDAAATEVLLRDVDAIRLEAEGLPLRGYTVKGDWPKGRQVGWPLSHALPQTLHLTIVMSKSWPPLTIALVDLSQSSQGSDEAAIGGSS